MSNNNTDNTEKKVIDKETNNSSYVPDITTQEKIANEHSEEPKEKPTRAQKFFRLLDKFGDLFFLNMYFTLTCIPIITIGAAFTALYTVTNKMVKDEEGPVRQEYFKAFKANFKPATIVWMIDLVYIILMYIQYVYMALNDNEAAKIILVVLGFEFILFAFAFPLQFPVIARYENTVGNYLKNSLVLAIANLSVWFRTFFIWVFPVVLYYLRPNYLVYTWFLWLLVLTALWAYICSMFYEKFYQKLENPQ